MITVINPGLLTTVQDKGRFGHRASGMPVSGVMDHYAHSVANIIVGNQEDCAVLETTLSGGKFRFHEDMLIAVTGADMNASVDGEKIANWSSYYVAKRSELEVRTSVNGLRGYLAVAGGIDVPLVMGSRSTYLPGNIGGFKGRALQKGDILYTGGNPQYRPKAFKVPDEYIPSYNGKFYPRVIPGPQDDAFTEEAISVFFSSDYAVTSDANRMGYRLEGPAVKHISDADIVSDGISIGAIQIPGNGMPIVLMADAQTTGGYGKIGVIIKSDLNIIAQAKPGDNVRFRISCDEEAISAIKEEKAKLLKLKELLVTL